MVMLIAPSVAGVFSSFGASIHLRFPAGCILQFPGNRWMFFVFSAEKRQKEDIPETCPETRVAGA
ncbi:hypothetical protein H8Z78_03990 [Dysosmobacter sp. NSJ-60]|nr:hypothetical protein [Dysosmobacter hominis]